jgi:hypothetical protein
MRIVAIEYPEKGKFNLTIKSNDFLVKDDILCLKIGNEKYYFKVGYISFDGNEEDEIVAKAFEYGYYNLISKNKNFDYRVLIGYCLSLEDDELVLNKLLQENRYC